MEPNIPLRFPDDYSLAHRLGACQLLGLACCKTVAPQQPFSGADHDTRVLLRSLAAPALVVLVTFWATQFIIELLVPTGDT
jgi:hypothetical protein